MRVAKMGFTRIVNGKTQVRMDIYPKELRRMFPKLDKAGNHLLDKDGKPAYKTALAKFPDPTRGETVASVIAEFERQIKDAREWANPETIAARLIGRSSPTTDAGESLVDRASALYGVMIGEGATPEARAAFLRGKPLPDTDLDKQVREIVVGHFDKQDVHIENLDGLIADLKTVMRLPQPLTDEEWTALRAGVLGLAGKPVAAANGKSVDYMDVLTEWRNANRLDETDKKYTAMKGRWDTFFAFLIANRDYPQGCRDMARVTSDDLQAYKVKLQAEANAGTAKVKTSKGIEDRIRPLVKLVKVAIEDQKNATIKATNPLIDFKVPRGKVTNKWIDFTVPDVIAILTKARTAPPEIRWPMWIAAYSGARLAEVVEATTADVEIDENGITIFHIRLEHRIGKMKSLKTGEISERPLPLHDAVLAEGFLAYVETIRAFHRSEGREVGLLFPQFNEWRGRINTDASDRLMDWLRDEVGITHPLKVFHSFRHTVKTRFRGVDENDVPYISREDVSDKLTGHATGKIGRTYGYFPNSTLRAAIKRVPAWPVELSEIA